MNIEIKIFIFLCITSSFSKEIDFISSWVEINSNETFTFHYNLTTNYSHYITFRLFEQKQFKYGLFNGTSSVESRSIEIKHRYELLNEIFYLFIICFHFLRSPTDIDIQCEDRRLAKGRIDQLDNGHHASYKPLFVPLMYALSVLMLLPVIVQHRRQKATKLYQREQQLQRLSISLGNESRCVDSKIGQVQIELVPFSSTKSMFNTNDEKVDFSLQQPMFDDDFQFEPSTVTADDCIAHLLNSAPWLRPTNDFHFDQNFSIRSMRPEKFHVRRSSPKSDGYSSIPLFRSNPAFIESDV